MLYITYGSILDQGASKIIQLSTDGVLLNGEQSAERTGVEVPLDQVPEIDLRGIVPYLVGAGQNRFAVIGGSGRIYQLEQVIPGVIPPSQLSCSLTITSEVVLNWTNNGPGVDDAYEGSIQLLRNGIAFATVHKDPYRIVRSPSLNVPKGVVLILTVTIT